MNIGSRWKRHRRTFERPFRESQAPLYWDIQRDCARKLLVDLLGEPSRFMDHFRLCVFFWIICVFIVLTLFVLTFPYISFRVSARSIMRTTYGIEVKDMTDQFVSLSEKASETMNVDTHFYLVNFIPACTSPNLKYLISLPSRTISRLDYLTHLFIRLAHWFSILISEMDPRMVPRCSFPTKSPEMETSPLTNA